VRQQVLDEMKQAKLDLISYTSLLRYRFPNYVNEALARASLNDGASGQNDDECIIGK